MDGVECGTWWTFVASLGVWIVNCTIFALYMAGLSVIIVDCACGAGLAAVVAGIVHRPWGTGTHLHFTGLGGGVVHSANGATVALVH